MDSPNTASPPLLHRSAGTGEDASHPIPSVPITSATPPPPAITPRKDDADTCRICRSEGSSDEPLFYPCKCSGSIKYVHQECLMEWLSHSQKKYCELCKTPFHFTKLYAPNMPKRLPAAVFVRSALLHLLAHLAAWLRGLLVAAVWLGAVPWVMRCMWRIMFWVGDAGWARDSHYIWPLLATANDKVVVAVEGSTAAAPAKVGGLNAMLQVPAALNITSQTLNLSQDPLVFKLARGLFTTMAAPLRRSDSLAMKANVTIDPLTARMLDQSHSSILSDVHALRTLSSSPFVNRFVMDVLEGQIITLSVVVVCILVFLIREWVVQQQPVVDLGAADADNALAQAGGRAQNRDQPRNDDEEHADDAAAQVDGANADAAESSAELGVAADTAAMEESKKRAKDLRTALGDLKTTRDQITTVEKYTNDQAVPELLRSQIIEELSLKATRLEQKILHIIRDQQLSWRDLRRLVRTTKPLEGILKELYERLEQPDTDEGDEQPSHVGSSSGQHASRTRPSMPARGRSSIATDIARSMEERVNLSDESSNDHTEQNRPEEHDEDGHDSNGSWQQVSAPHPSVSQSPSRAASPHSVGQAEPGGEENADAHDAAGAVDGPLGAGDDLSWVSTAGSTDGRTVNDDELPENPFAPDDVEQAPPAADEAAGEAPAPVEVDEVPVEAGLVARLSEWLWGDIQPVPAPNVQDADAEFVGADDEHVVQDLANEAPFVPFEGAQPVQQNAEPAREEVAEPVDVEVPADIPPPADEAIAAAAVAGAAGAAGGDINALDAEALEDAEDLEGILELIGMQGPLGGLVQNAVFSSILISLSVALCVFVPYIWGKLVLLHVAEPSLFYKVPLKMATIIADLAIDASLTVLGFFFYGVFQLYRLLMLVLSVNITDRKSYQFVLGVHEHAKGALDRLVGGIVATNEIEAGDFLDLSMTCHAALYAVEEWVISEARFLLDVVNSVLSSLLSADIFLLANQFKELLASTSSSTLAALQSLLVAFRSFYTTGSIQLPTGTSLVVPNDRMLSYWNARDRFLAILAGYAAVGLICGLYVKVAPITTSRRGKHIESHIVDACQQAGGVLKVILIISIEMIAFPLFCGFLLDFALMPLFENATFASRLDFALSSPWTSGFVHWFVGTCYMFHFALFVSMCRRILRTGVLYFIRDPDDPTFHPVRDVLERNVITQLRKIAFSAIVYGALIVVCLGGIVWGLWAALDGVLPIHWSSTGSNIEFPLDILFYNFLTPFVVHYAKPSAGITAMYDWWFRQAARALRLSDFLFREQKFDEEGHWVRHTWKAWLTRRVNEDLSEEDVDRLALAEGSTEEDALDDGTVRFVPDGRYVRAPASDQVRIPKGTPVFVPVNVENERLDGKSDDEGLHAASSNMVTKVYIPPWFKVRIGLFIVAVWLFAAATGISVTILPLLLGRYLLSSIFGPKEFINDIYAFSLGIYTLGGLLYAGIHRHAILSWLHSTFIPADGGRQLLASAWNGLKRVASVLYVYSTLAVGLPLINAVLLEVYVLMPMHYLFDASEHHVMHLVQDWTLGILYVRIGMRIFLADADSRPARAIRQVFARGYLQPDAARATRYFILPALLAFALLMAAPFASAALVNKTYLRAAEADDKIAVMRMAYPIASATVILLLVARTVMRAAGKWRARIRDEVYLVGERLHNFGERKAGRGKEKADPRPGDIVAL